MKKIFLLLVVFLLAISAIPTASAAFDATDNNHARNWEIYNFYSNVYGMKVDLPIPAGVERIKVTIPISDYNIATTGGIESEVIFYDGISQLYVFNLNELVGFDTMTTAVELTFSLQDFGTYDLTDADSVYIAVMQTFETPPAGYYSYFVGIADIIYEPVPYLVNYYVNGVLDDTEIVYNNQIPFNAPTAPEGYIFIGWRTIDGDLLYINSANVIRSSYVLNLYDKLVVRLYAYFVTTADPIDLDTTPANNAPAWFNSFVSALGLDDQEGLAIFYAILLLLSVVAIMFIPKLPSFFFLIVTGGITILFISWGILPSVGVLLMVVIFILLLLQLLKPSTKGGEVE